MTSSRPTRTEIVESRAEAVIQVLREMAEEGSSLNATDLAKRAGVSRAYVYRQDRVYTALEEERSNRGCSRAVAVGTRGNGVSASSLKADLASEQELTKRLRKERDTAVRRVAELTGARLAEELETSEDWQAKAVELTRANERLAIENRRLQEDLDASRSRNRLLTKQLNQQPR